MITPRKRGDQRENQQESGRQQDLQRPLLLKDATQTQAEERGHQYQVVEVGDEADLRGNLPDKRQLEGENEGRDHGDAPAPAGGFRARASAAVEEKDAGSGAGTPRLRGSIATPSRGQMQIMIRVGAPA